MNKETRKNVIFYLLCFEWFCWIIGCITSLTCIFTQAWSPLVFFAILIGGGISIYVFTAFYKLMGTVDELQENNENLQNSVEILSDELDKLDFELSKIRSKTTENGKN